MTDETPNVQSNHAAARRFVGTWRLLSIDNSPLQPDRGDKPTGLLFYDGKGNMAVQIAPSRPRRPFVDRHVPTAEEAHDAILGYTAYFGTFSVDAGKGTVTHHRHGNISPGATGDFVRRFKFLAEDRMALMPIENDVSLTWERVG
ncbi:lipocalin-like domain-containing protein [Labrys sp. LIt4]|uniref:lipocalin-like domain-containing protein n=1 Tax=Labrys sp. LIt4 TaxID=2821355 RepID=UPI001ADF3017|nr:lipocalin-like domain-containing protein [Labrys sp. LIt4]MBP0580524.1 lipocalin-like domain-containing protein [Labrys sp. LIt4]